MKRGICLALAAILLLAVTGCGAQSAAGGSSAAATTLTGKGQGFGGVITVTLTMEGDAITAASLEGPDETETIGGAALAELEGQIVAAGGAEIDGVAGATVTSDGVRAAVRNALDPQANPFEEAGDGEGEAVTYPTGAEPVEIPDDRTIVSATTYGLYTKETTSPQDAVIRATLYWDLDNDAVWAIRFWEPMLPWDDNGAASGWANVTENADLLTALGEDGVVTFTSGDSELTYAKYIQIGDVVWTGEVGSDPACEVAVVYSASIDGQTVKMNDYVATEAGGEWFVNAAEEPARLLAAPDAAEAAGTVEIPVKETNGHGVGFWPSPLTFPGNIQAIKDFVTENGFDYDYYADGGMTQNEEGYWQTPDAVSGATLAETPTYLDMLKTLYERIQAGDYVAEN